MITNRPARRASTNRRAVVLRGFSLIELVAVLAIISIMGAMAIPRYGAAMARYRVQAAAVRVTAEIDRIRDKSRRAGVSHTMTFGQGRRSFVITKTVGAALESRVRLTEEPYLCAINTNDLGGDAVMIVDGYGLPDSGGTIVLRHGDLGITITVDTVGGTTLSKPFTIAKVAIVPEIEGSE